MTSIKIPLLLILLFCIAVPAFAADTVRTYDTVVHYDTTYLYDTTGAVQKQLNEMKSDFYDRALQALDYKKSYISILLTVIGIMLVLFGALSGYTLLSYRKVRDRLDKEMDKVVEDRREVSKIHREMESSRDKILKLKADAEKAAKKAVAPFEAEEAKEERLAPEERIKLINEGDAEQSIDEYEKLLFAMELRGISRDKLPTSLHKNVGLNYFALERYEKSLEELSDYIKIEPRDCDALFVGARCLEELQNYRGAIAWYDTIAKIDPNNTIGYNYWIFNNWGVNLERLFHEQKETSLLEQAIEKYKKAVNIDEGYALAHFNWGVALMDLGGVRQDVTILNEALAKYRKALELDEKAYVVYGNLSITLLMKLNLQPNVDLALEAKAMALKALELAPLRKDYHYLVACANSRLGKKSEMLETLKIAIEHDAMLKKKAKENKDFEEYWEDPDFIALTKEN